MIVSVPLRNNVFYLYLAVPKETTHRTFGFNDNTIRNQKIFRPISGNTQKMVLVKFYDDPVPCRKRYKKGA